MSEAKFVHYPWENETLCGQYSVYTEVYLRPCQTSMMEFFFCWNSQQRLVVNYFLKKALVLDVWQGPKYTSDAYVVVYVIVALSR